MAGFSRSNSSHRFAKSASSPSGLDASRRRRYRSIATCRGQTRDSTRSGSPNYPIKSKISTNAHRPIFTHRLRYPSLEFPVKATSSEKPEN